MLLHTDTEREHVIQIPYISATAAKDTSRLLGVDDAQCTISQITRNEDLRRQCQCLKQQCTE